MEILLRLSLLLPILLCLLLWYSLMLYIRQCPPQVTLPPWILWTVRLIIPLSLAVGILQVLPLMALL